MNRKLLYYFVALSILWGCNKDGTTTKTIFQGHVIDYDNNIPKSNAAIVINRFDAITLISPNMYVDLVQDFILTDEYGNYYLEFDHNEKLLYHVTTSEIGYLEKSLHPEVLATIIKNNTIHEDTILVGKTGCLKIDLENIADGFDSLLLKCNIETYRLYPQINDTTIHEKYLFKDNNQVHIYWKIIDKPNENEFSADLELIPMDTLTLHINF
jgi:hypothetical protein